MRARSAAALALAFTTLARADIVAISPDGAWQILDAVPAAAAQAEPWIRPDIFKPASINWAAAMDLLQQAPMEDTPEARAAPLTLWLPMPTGGFARFHVVESPVMEPGLAAQFPQIKTYLGQGVDDPAATARLDTTPQGFHAQVLSPSGAVYIDPYSRGDRGLYAVYYKRDYRKKNDGWECLTPGSDKLGLPPLPAGGNQDASGDTRRTYRLAVGATGEYTAFQGGTVIAGLSAIVTAINRVTGVYETEVAIRLSLVSSNNLIVYTNASTDPYTNGNPSSLLSQNQATCDSVIGSANYDIGHVFSTAGGGLAGLGVVCRAGSKAQGETGLSSPIGDPFYIDYVAHEMGHQFGANHCFNSSTSNCGGGNRNASTAYEPGSASTIMGYAGICGADDLQPHSDPYFVNISYDEIRAYVTTGSGAGCGSAAATGNAWPSANAGATYTIPKGTPFALTASGSDPNGDPITFCWEERDLGASTTLAQGDTGSGPIIRSFNPSTSPTRIIPRLSNLLANTFAPGEVLPNTTRTMNWRVMVRDNRAGGGGVNAASTAIAVTAAAGPFVVTSPNTAVSWSGVQTVTWNVAGTAAAPVSCASVSILLSTDGGTTFPTVLLASTPNSGSAQVTLPSMSTATARIQVAAVGNIFFDISNANFTITPSAPPPCYANCDGSTAPPILNVNDFQCFLNLFAQGDPQANCDGSTQPPVLNVNDFQCFLNLFAQGCP